MGCCGLAERIETAKVNGKALRPPDGVDESAGPTKNRSCRDVVFLILFIAFCIGGIVYMIVVGSKSDINRLIHGYDSYGNVCGKKNPKYFDLAKSGQDMTSKKFFNFIEIDGLRGSCVATCETGNSSSFMKVLGYYCYPALSEELFNFGLFKTIALDIQNSWRQIIIIAVVGLVFSIFFTFALRFLAPIIVWLTVIIMALLCIAGTIALWVFWDKYKKEAERQKVQGDPLWSSVKSKSDVFLASAIIATIFTVILLIILIAMRNRIKLVIQLFIEAGKVITRVPLLLFQPFWTLITLALVIFFYASGFVLVTIAGNPVKTGNYVIFQPEPILLHLRWYHLFGFFWVSQFVISCQEMIIAGATATWYFTRDKSRLGSPILTSLSNLVRYHLGSVALGSLIIAIVQMIRAVLKYVENRTKNASGFLSFCFKCCQCCLWCFERFLKFLSRNAYIEIAIHGHGFCKSAQMAFKIIMSNALRITAINFVGDFVLALIKGAVVLITFFIGLEIMKHNNQVYSIYPGAIVGAIITLIFVCCFVSVYEMIIDTLFICFCEDSQMNDGLEKPYFMSKGLMQFVENSSKALKAQEERERMGNAKGGGGQWGQPVHTIQPTAIPIVYNDVGPARPPLSPGNMMKTGMTPLHPGYKPVSQPPSPSRLMTPGTNNSPGEAQKQPEPKKSPERKKTPNYDSDQDSDEY